MAGSTLWTVTFDHDSGLPEDRSENTFSFHYPSARVDELNVFDMLVDFYTVPAPSAGEALVWYLSSRLSGHATVRCYDRADPSPRNPTFEDEFTFTPGTDALPEEVALCLSFKGAAISGIDPARQRGRIYLGPLAMTHCLNTVNGRPGNSFREDLAFAGAQLRTAANAAVNWQWVIHSNVAGGMDTDVVGGWVDDAFDTQRRRGPAATTRTLW